MSVDDARAEYAVWVGVLAGQSRHPRFAACSVCDWIEHQIEAASLAYDLACAEASRQRTREAVAWA